MDTIILIILLSIIILLVSILLLKSTNKNSIKLNFNDLKKEIKEDISDTINTHEEQEVRNRDLELLKKEIITHLTKTIRPDLVEKQTKLLDNNQKIMFSDNLNRELLSIYPADYNILEKPYKEIKNQKIRKSLENIFNQIIPVSEKFYSFAKNGNTQYIAKFPKELINGLGKTTEFQPNRITGGLRTTIRDIKTGQVLPGGQGILETQQALTTFTSVIAVWQILTIVTAQHHLSEINQKLNILKQDLETLKAKIDNDRLGILLGNLKYLQFLHESINTENELSINPKIEYTLETIERECYQVYQAIFMDFKYQSKNLLNFDEKNERITNIDEKLIQTIHDLGSIIKPILIALNSIYTIIKVQSALFPNSSLTIIKLQDLKEQMNDIKTSYNNDLKKLNDKVNQAKGGIISNAETERLRILKAFSDIKIKIDEESSPIIEQVNKELRIVKEIEKQDDELLLEFDNQGRIKTIKQLENK